MVLQRSAIVVLSAFAVHVSVFWECVWRTTFIVTTPDTRTKKTLISEGKKNNALLVENMLHLY